MTEVEGGLSARALRSMAWVAVNKGGSQILSLVMFAILGRLLVPSDFGLVALAGVFIAMVGLFVDSGFSQVLVQRSEIDQAQVSTAFWTSNGIALGLYGLLALAAHPLSLLYHQPQLDDVLYVLGLQLPITALSSTPAALLEREFAFRDLTVRELAGSIVASVAGVAAAYAGFGVWALLVQSVGSATISCAVLWFRSSWRPTFEFSVPDLRKMLDFGISILGTDAVNLANSQADKLLVGSFLGPAALGYYYVGSRIVGIVSDSLTVVIGEVTLTTFSRLQHEHDRMLRAYRKATFASASIALPGFAALAVLAPVIIPLVFGPQWSHSVLIMQLLVPSAALTSILYFDKNLLLAKGYARDAFKLATANMVFGLGLLLVAAPFGAVGIAFSRSVRQFAFWPVRLAVLRRRVGLDVARYLTQFIKPLVATAFASSAMVLMMLLPLNDWLRFLAAGGVGFVVYLVAILALARDEVVPMLTNALGDRPAPRLLALAGRRS